MREDVISELISVYDKIYKLAIRILRSEKEVSGDYVDGLQKALGIVANHIDDLLQKKLEKETKEND